MTLSYKKVQFYHYFSLDYQKMVCYLMQYKLMSIDEEIGKDPLIALWRQHNFSVILCKPKNFKRMLATSLFEIFESQVEYERSLN